MFFRDLILEFCIQFGANRVSLPTFVQSSVPSGPADVRAVTSGPGSAMVSWRPPAAPNGVIKKYTVFRREVMNGEEVEVSQGHHPRG